MHRARLEQSRTRLMIAPRDAGPYCCIDRRVPTIRPRVSRESGRSITRGLLALSTDVSMTRLYLFHSVIDLHQCPPVDWPLKPANGDKSATLRATCSPGASRGGQDLGEPNLRTHANRFFEAPVAQLDRAADF